MDICYVCPKCSSDQVKLTLPSQTGAYCQCRSCGHQWHDEKKPPSRGKPDVLKRKSDHQDRSE